MKYYNVKELADLLGTNPETIRRWIRSGRLGADQESRKGGNAISETSLKAFLAKNPKYAIAAGNQASANPSGGLTDNTGAAKTAGQKESAKAKTGNVQSKRSEPEKAVKSELTEPADMPYKTDPVSDMPSETEAAVPTDPADNASSFDTLPDFSFVKTTEDIELLIRVKEGAIHVLEQEIQALREYYPVLQAKTGEHSM